MCAHKYNSESQNNIGNWNVITTTAIDTGHHPFEMLGFPGDLIFYFRHPY
jgi:hypothetical protein